MFFQQNIEGGEDLVEQKYELLRRDVRGQVGKTGEIGNQHTGFRVFVRDGDFALFHS